MAEFEAPSFSLGLDFELDSQPIRTPSPLPSPKPSPKHTKRFLPTQNLRTIEDDDDDDDFESPVPSIEPKCTEPPLTLKRLRRGPTSNKPTSGVENWDIKEGTWCDVEDEIEDFSSEEDRPAGPSKFLRSVSSNSKLPLHHRRNFSMQTTTQCALKGKKPDKDPSACRPMEISNDKSAFSKSNISPIRSFQLIDLDSDDPSPSEHLKKDVKAEPPAEKSTVSSKKMKFKASHVVSESEELWKGFLTDKTSNISTPALDEVCEEYFSSLKHRNANQNTNEDIHPNSVLAENSMQQRPDGPSVPAHSYYFHEDLRIQKLVRERLPHFFPLDAKNNQGIKQSDGSIDYIGQFSPRGGSQSGANKVAADKSSTKQRKKNNSKKTSEVPTGWVDPKVCDGAPKDAGKRRVHAVGKSAGQWLTSSDGKRVYVTRNGQEMSGRSAYIHYRKETGSGFKKSKKNSTSNKKSSAKNKKR
ncbi:unnamed protein product [Cuscuta epithymum]|uniref:Uncharacterized protein n=1 Tax=Cuscuta epithymum TaxID=186058 RepID=A0AAV0EBY5_9ASTE|nr:unnamed protein product [Cuscuta epithymum]